MPLDLSFGVASPEAKARDSAAYVIIGQKDVLSKVPFWSFCDEKTWAALLAQVSSDGDFGNRFSGVVTRVSGQHAVVHVISLPTVASRHNSPGRPDAIFNKFPSSSGIPDMSVYCVLRNSTEAFAAGCSVARSLPMYTRKNGNSGDEDMQNIKVSCDFVVPGGTPGDLNELKTVCPGLSLAAEGIRGAARLVDMPCSEFNCKHGVDLATKIAEEVGADIEIIQGKELDTRGFGGLWGVGKAAVNLPALVCLSRKPKNSSSAEARTVVWAGKGIVYDTGGLSIKTKTGMPGMKRDMGGAAACLYAFKSAASGTYAKVLDERNITLHAILCFAENAVGPEATRPDDILTMYSGKSVEVNNTDAEGRLVLGDGVAFATKHLNPDVLCDLATLTGAQGIATGKRHAAIYTNDEDIESACFRSGILSGDLVHALPYAPEFFRDEFNSSVADMKNSVKDRSNGQSSCAGQFIGNHIQSDYKGKWLHIDMAYPVEIGERATGYGVALLLQMFLRDNAASADAAAPAAKKARL